jgi:YHS domain-containing protein
MARFVLLTILLILVARAFWRIVDGILEAGRSGSGHELPKAVKLVRDPVCGVFVAPGSALSLTAGGQTRYFCSERCRDEFGKRARA